MIGLHDFNTLHNEEFRKEVLTAFENILANNAFVEGEFNHKFEKEFAQMQEAKHCLLVANGTDALEISLLAHGVKPGDKIGVPGITFYATAEAVLNVGATPVLIDVIKETGLICPKSAEANLKKHNLKGLIPVHIYGLPADMVILNKLAKENNIFLIEDAAQASGAFIEGKPVGSGPNLTTFSFYPTKNLSAFGDAGAILTSDDKLAEKIKIIRNHGRGSDGHAMGRNSRCDHLQAAVLSLKLKNVEKYNQARKDVAKKYHELLGQCSSIKLIDSHFIETSAFHLYPIHLDGRDTRDKLIKHLHDNQIGCANFYDRALSEEPALSQCEGDREISEQVSGSVVCLPMNPFISDEEIQTVAKAVLGFFS